jgi:hypothetical protein
LRLYQLDENIPADLCKFEPGDIDKKILDAINFVLEEISFEVDRAVINQHKQLLMS